jgi:hypothetical protein
MPTREMTEEEVADLKEAFAMFDINGDGESACLCAISSVVFESCLSSMPVYCGGNGTRRLNGGERREYLSRVIEV